MKDKDSETDILSLLKAARQVTSPLHTPRQDETGAPLSTIGQPDNAIGFFTIKRQPTASRASDEPDFAKVLVLLIQDLMDDRINGSISNHYATLVANGEIPELKPYDRDAVLRVVESFGLQTYPATNTGFVRMFIDLHGHRIRSCREEEQLYAYDDAAGMWTANRGDYVENLVSQTVEALSELVPFIDDEQEAKVFKRLLGKLDAFSAPSSVARALRARPSIAVSPDKFDADTQNLNVRNGVIELPTRALIGHDPVFYCTKSAPVTFDDSADCPFFKKMISDTFEGDTETIEYVQSLLGYCLSGDTSAKHYWIFHGGSDSGKSTLLRVMGTILGGQDGFCGTIPLETLEAGGGDRKNLGLASLHGKERLAVVDELPPGFKIDTGKLKAITGDTTGLAMRLNFRSYTSRKIHFKLVIATNHLPNYDKMDSGIHNRVVVIPFKQQFTRVAGFDSHWQAELPGILNWLLQGYAMYESRGLGNLPPAITKATQAHIQDADVLATWLAQNTIKVPGAPARYGVQKVLNRYNKYVIDMGLPEQKATHVNFGRLLREHGWIVTPDTCNSYLNHLTGVEELRFKGDCNESKVS